MKYIIKPFAEIMIKSKPVKKKFLKKLQSNLKENFTKIDSKIDVILYRDKIEIYFIDSKINKQVLDILNTTFGIEKFIEVIEYDYIDFDNTLEKVKDFYLKKISWKTFVVRVKRSGIHNFKSVDIERFIGWWLFQSSDNAKVNLKNPEITINIEIKDNKLYLVKDIYKWLWGYPVWLQEKVISLLSGGFDSGVSSFLVAKRWCKTDYLFFNLWWNAHELWVKQVAYYLWSNYNFAYNANFITVDFTPVIEILLTRVSSRFRWIILKRFMIKIATKLTKIYWYKAIVTWESIWQVSSQTLINLWVISEATDEMIFRPLLTYDKQDIVNISKKIWTYEYAISMPEYCWVVSDKPATSAKLSDILSEEENIWEEIINKILDSVKTNKVKDLLDESREISDIEEISEISPDDKIIDLREEEKINSKPLKLEKAEIIKIPFYEVNHKFPLLNQENKYLFYCDKWVLSRLHWLYLKEKWFHNIKIYRPS